MSGSTSSSSSATTSGTTSGSSSGTSSSTSSGTTSGSTANTTSGGTVTPTPLTAGTLSVAIDNNDLPVLSYTSTSGGVTPIVHDVYRSTTTPVGASVDTLLADSVSFPFTDGSVEDNTTYYYMIVSEDSTGATASSNTVTVVSGGRFDSEQTAATIAARKNTLVVTTADQHWVIGTAINSTLSATVVGAKGSVSYYLQDDRPLGVQLSTSGTFSGAPLNVSSGTFTVLVVDSAGNQGLASVTYVTKATLVVVSPTTIMTQPGGEYFNQLINIQGGYAPYNITLTSAVQNGSNLLNGTITQSWVQDIPPSIYGRLYTQGLLTLQYSVVDRLGQTGTGSMVINVTNASSVRSKAQTSLPGVGEQVSGLLTSFVNARSASVPELINSASNYVLAVKYAVINPTSDALTAFLSIYGTSAPAWAANTQFSNGFNSQTTADQQLAFTMHSAFMAILYPTSGYSFDRSQFLTLVGSQDILVFLENLAVAAD